MLNPFQFQTRQQKASRKDRLQRIAAALGHLSIPVAGDQTTVKRLPITLDIALRNPKVWVALLMDAMLRRGWKGMRHPPANWRPGGDRRHDKIGTTKLSRRLAQ